MNSVKEILRFFNIPCHIKKLFIRRKIKKYTNQENNSNYFIKLLLGLAILIGGVYLNFTHQNIKLAIGSFITLVFLFFKVSYNNRPLELINDEQDEIREIILKDEDEKIIKNWNIHDYTACLIGKKTQRNMVNIDLSEATYAALVSREHAVMNNTNNGWFFEDIGSSNGSGIKRKQDGKKFKVKPGQPYKMYPGDTIYIANTKLLVK
jgi:hypothetical protein